MPNPDAIRKLSAIGLFLLPVGLVRLADLYLGKAGPLQAQAAEVDPSAPSAKTNGIKAPTWTARQIDAGKYVVALREKSFAPTPFLYESHDDGASSSKSPTVSNIPTGSASAEEPKFVVQAILSSSIGNTALIDGKPYHEGDTLRDSRWVIQSIAVGERSVTLRDPGSDRTVTIAVEMPLQKGQ